MLLHQYGPRIWKSSHFPTWPSQVRRTCWTWNFLHCSLHGSDHCDRFENGDIWCKTTRNFDQGQCHHFCRRSCLLQVSTYFIFTYIRQPSKNIEQINYLRMWSGFWVLSYLIFDACKLPTYVSVSYYVCYLNNTYHSSPRRLAGGKKSNSYNHKTTIWVSHEYYLNPEFHKILLRPFWFSNKRPVRLFGTLE